MRDISLSRQNKLALVWCLAETVSQQPMNPRRPGLSVLTRPCGVEMPFWIALSGIVWVLLVEPSLAGEPLWENGSGFRSRPLAVPGQGKTGFTSIPGAVSGVRFTNSLSDLAAAANRILENGSGVALGDVDGDGWCDIYLCRIDGPNVLYRNLGNWKFEDITAKAGVACEGQHSTGAVFADIDGDGDLDLLVNSIGGGTRSFRNDGHGHFEEIKDTRLVRRFGSTSMALADIDGDGDLDLFVANYRTDTHLDHPPGLNVEAHYVDGRIVVTPADRFIPLMPRLGGVEVIEKGERSFLYFNDGQGRFAPVSWTTGGFLDEDGHPLKEPPTDWLLSVMFRDLNGDLAPDLYTCADFFYFPDRIWINHDSRQFRAIDPYARRNMSVSAMAVDFGDINRDGYDDFFVTDMVSRRHVCRQYQRPNMMRGILEQPLEDPAARPEVARNTLFLSRGDGTYAEIAQLSGVQWSEWSWNGIFLDVDLDGYEDLLIPTGNNHDVQDADVLMELARIREPHTLQNNLKNIQKFPRFETANLAFRNRGDLTFEEVGKQWGFDQVGISQGMALADLDNDGDLDVVINCLNHEPLLLRNESNAPRVAVRLKGSGGNTRGIGAKIWVRGGPVPQSQEMICGGRYLSGDDAMRVFACGNLTNDLSIEVFWRSGKHSFVPHAYPNRLYEIDEGGASVISDQSSVISDQSSVISHQSPVVGKQLGAGSAADQGPGTKDQGPQMADNGQRITDNGPQSKVWFQDVSDRIAHTHFEAPFDDFSRQPLLPVRLSHLGPGVAWFDLDGDGWDDLIVGSGRGGKIAVFRNNQKGGFEALTSTPFHDEAVRDQTTILGWRDSRGHNVLLAGTANYEDGLAQGSAVVQFDPESKVPAALLPADASSVGPLALGDFDGDGHLDLFVGGRTTAGRHPEAASSRILTYQDGHWVTNSLLSAPFEKLGLVSGAVFSDLDGDGLPELILACEWGPIRVFQFQAREGRVREITESLGLNRYSGWWTGVTTADLDGDGRLEIIATNWGRNNKYGAFLKDSLLLYYGDLTGNGTVDVLEAYFDPELKKVVPWRDWLTVTKALPFIAEKFPTYHAFGQASVAELVGERFARLRVLTANTLDSVVFWRRDNRFEPKPLPIEAQFSPAFGVTVGDFDGDGNEDLFLAQNFFCVEPDTSRYDAGRGLCLRGDGHGGFQAVPGQESGIKVYGEQRGCAAADFDGDGRLDLVVTQNHGATKLYRNQWARPGLRVRVNAGPLNPTGIGTTLRLAFDQRLGPAREIHAGSGYWSQDSAVQVMATPEPPSGLWVRWPGGKTATASIPAGAKEITLDLSGTVTVLRR
jgi:enediyne biosynthesis protein E4